MIHSPDNTGNLFKERMHVRGVIPMRIAEISAGFLKLSDLAFAQGGDGISEGFNAFSGELCSVSAGKVGIFVAFEVVQVNLFD